MRKFTLSRHAEAIILPVIANVIWSTAFFTAKIALAAGIGPWTLAGLRVILAGIILAVWNRNFARDLSQVVRHFRVITRIAFFQTFLAFLLIYSGLNLVQGAIAAIMIGTGPVLSAVMAHFFMKNDRLTRKSTVSMIIGFAGVLIISLSTKPWSSEGLKSLGGVGMILLGVLCGSYSNILIAKADRTLNYFVLNFSQMLIGGVPLLVLGLLTDKPARVIQPAVILPALGWLVFVSAVPTTLWSFLLKDRKAKISEINLWGFIAPVLGAVLSWSFLPGEFPTVGAVTGMVLIGFALILYYNQYPRVGLS